VAVRETSSALWSSCETRSTAAKLRASPPTRRPNRAIPANVHRTINQSNNHIIPDKFYKLGDITNRNIARADYIKFFKKLPRTKISVKNAHSNCKSNMISLTSPTYRCLALNTRYLFPLAEVKQATKKTALVHYWITYEIQTDFL